MSFHDLPRTIAVCEECGKPIASLERGDGTLLPIGSKTCPCGSTSYRAFTGGHS